MTAPMPMPRQLNPNIPAEVENIILKSTAKDSDDRYQTAGEMATAMERVLNRLAAAIKEEEVVEEVRSKKIKPEYMPSSKQPGAKKVQKMALIVILGLLGLCILGVVVMGVFDICPPVGPWPQPPWCPGSPYKLPTFGGGSATSVPSLMITEGTLGSILFQDDFEGEISSRWGFGSSPYTVSWEALEMDGRTVMHSLPPNPPGDSSTAEIKPTSWENYAVQFDFRFLKPDQFGAYYFELTGQLTDCPPTIQSIQAYSAIISTDMVQLSKNLCRQEGRLQLSESDKNINLEVWHTLQYMFIGNRVQILIDGEKYVDFTDDDEPLTTGGDLWITSYGESEILVDNLKVYEVIPSVEVTSTETTLTNESGTERQEVVCLDGSSYIEIPYSETLDLPEALTLEAWVQIDEFSNNCPYSFCGLSPVINQGQSFSAAGNYTLFLTPETLGFLFQPKDSKLFAPAKLKPGWNHVAVTHTFGRGDASRLYLNGESLK
ncbi:MAG: LamG-like jellyroll fold domain-containing protein, partial [Anaerolineales bacterium]|nr:LamG-like jellyroll fold domain-containing protein [Anaerolineales bacterium]